MLQHILVGVDGSGPSRHAARFALSLAGQTHAKVTLLSVLPQPEVFPVGPLGTSVVTPPASEAELARVRQQLDAMAAERSGVSTERIVSGNGLGALYDFFASRGGREPRAVAKRLAQDNRNAVISELGLARQHRPAALAVDLFASIYGAEAGNLALHELSLGGVFVTGNIGRRIVPARAEIFLDAFRKKGRFSALLAEVPVAVVTDPLVGVQGALAMARDLLREDDG